jgi:hypothetical protein
MGKDRVWVKKILTGMDRLWLKKIIMDMDMKISPPVPHPIH